MAVFIASSDETEIGGHRGMFMHSGLLAPEDDWSRYFAPAWEERVLLAPPAIPYLHVIDLRNREWQKANGICLTDSEINTKLDEGVDVIMQLGSFVAVGTRMNAGVFLDAVGKKKIVKMTLNKKPQRLLVDHVSFFGHVTVLKYVNKHYPDAAKVDFLVDRKHGVFDRLTEYYATLAASLRAIGEPDLPRLLGKLIPGGPDTRVPLQAADLVLWHIGRSFRPQHLTREDHFRLKKLEHMREAVTELPDHAVRKMGRVFLEKLNEQRISELRRDNEETHASSAQRNKGQIGRRKSAKAKEAEA